MDQTLIFAILAITSALIFYTIGVWGEKLQGTLKPWHLVFFILGLICDTLGTTAMSIIADSSGTQGITLHGITGTIAILLMLIHAVWATIVIVKNKEDMKLKFHKFSIIVWCIWLVPYFIGMFIGMM